MQIIITRSGHIRLEGMLKTLSPTRGIYLYTHLRVWPLNYFVLSFDGGLGFFKPIISNKQ